MDASQAFAYQQNKGTLVPGQSISVNKYTVQVERYLSQGGFAHVYLVRTATPVYNTTHHVLKRIAVANEAMLTDVKKEVDIMRLLKGHPNIVHLIDAAWHRMSNGLYEVFILMEFCPGGGIIDMMNRRLRERLTESEILQIFVDVCEGVAYMHNSRPPLLHRDLKVENILQASPTSFKLCDFGSATTVATRPPANMQEVRALEEDLNRHTTLQYRAPEMIDAHLRRPIDEKSDVWALGVLLYKLCYYTTPFEEHGPLAILNVQYRIPPYPVYSSQMNALIAYLNLNLLLLGFSHNKNHPLLILFICLSSSISAKKRRSSSPTKATETTKEKNWLEDEEKAWQAVTAQSARTSKPQKDVWSVGSDYVGPKAGQRGFGDDFGEQLWKSSNLNSQVMKPTVSPSPGLKVAERPPLSHRISDQPLKPATRIQEKDAFDGLGLSSNNKPAPTLAEARKLRTGLAISVNQYSNGKYGNNFLVPKPSLSPKPSYTSPSPSGPQTLGIPAAPLKQDTSGSSWSSQPPSSRPGSSQPQSPDAFAAEYKFPSLEELDASFAPGHNRQRSKDSLKPVPHVPSEPKLSSKLPVAKPTNTAASNLPRPNSSSPMALRSDGARTEQISSIALRTGATTPGMDALKATKTPSSSNSISRGNSVRKRHGSSATKTSQDRSNGLHNPKISSSQMPVSSEVAPRLPSRPSQRDWLTGDDISEFSSPATRTVETPQPVLRDSPSKRASYMEKSHIPIHQAVAVTPESLPPESPSRRAHRVFPDLETAAEPARTERLTENWSPVTPSAPQQLKESYTSSSADEGPEDVTRSINVSPDTKKRRKGRQSSVHDLVDLWGGGGGGGDRVSPEKKRETRKDSARATVTPLPKSEGLSKHRSLATPVIPTTPHQRSISPQLVSSPSPSRPAGNLIGQQSNVTNPPPVKSNITSPASSSRSRPQSMFIFPSKSTDGYAPPSAGLTPPEVPQTRTARRTSISDMVQRFEAIDAVAKTGIPTASSRIVSQKVPVPVTENKSSSQASALSQRDGHINPPSTDTDDTHFPSKNRPTSRATPRPSPNKRYTTSNEPPELATPRAHRISTKADAQIPFPQKRKPTLAPDEPARSGDIRSPSPERPYQGVGKLIDQWQRKTAVESEATRTPTSKRGGLVAKQAALVNGGN
ncbi:hypothetical protein HHX47_DHR1000927 [Lentinula edodes]|nr:hypothetical protein HHX47_DHR1000927 [Lentinula edodes]